MSVVPITTAPAAEANMTSLAERALLGALMLDPTAWSDVVRVVRVTDISRADHRLIFGAIAELIARDRSPDPVTVVARLHEVGQLEAVGGRELIAELYEETPSAANVRAYAVLVREHSDRRRLITLGNDVAAIAQERDPAAALQYAHERLEAFGAGESTPKRAPRPPLDWEALESMPTPVREWAIESWLGMGHTTLMAGAGGSGKTSVAQALGSRLALGGDYLGHATAARRVLMWAAEDDEAELWRRQIAIAAWCGVPISEFTGRLFLHSYDGEQVELAELLDQRRLVSTVQYELLCEQIGDYKADVVILDNVARLYAGNENDRHQVTSFIAMLTRAARPTNAAVLLLAHPGKAAGSEYSGTTAWEGAVRSRLYLGRTLPEANPEDDDARDDAVRYLCRRKANYSPLDWRRLVYREGVMVPEEPVAAEGQRMSPLYARAIVKSAVRKLAEMGEHGNTSTSSPSYLPRLAKQYKLLEQTTEREFANAMCDLRKCGELTLATVGRYSNRNPREGLVLVAEVHK